MITNIKFYKQKNTNDCALSCIKTIYNYYKIELPNSVNSIPTSKNGVSIEHLSNFFEREGFIVKISSITLNRIKNIKKPSILLWNQNHYVVIYGMNGDIVNIIDPAIGKMNLPLKDFATHWLLSANEGIVFEIISVPKAKSTEKLDIEDKIVETNKWSDFYKLLFKHKKGVIYVLCLLLIGSIIELIVPFLTQSIVDRGINNNDLDFITLIIISQIFLFIGSLSSGFIRSWIMLHIGIQINVDLSEDYVSNILSKPIQFFATKKEGDLLQRIFDNIRIERFMTITSLSFVLAVLNLFIFSIVLLIFSTNIFLVFIISTILIIIWMTIFMNKRKVIDQERFIVSSESRNTFLEIINGIEEIYLNNLEAKSKKNWLDEQMRLLKIRLKLLLVSQYQQSGSSSINQIKNVIITFMSAKYVLTGHLTIGSMIAIQYLIGQLNGPIRSIVRYIQDRQDAKLSVERLGEITNESKVNDKFLRKDIVNFKDKILLTNISVTQNNTPILKNISIEIPYGSFISIVGQSGSGKTTLLKTLSKLIEPKSGRMKLGGIDFSKISREEWVENVCVVSQGGYIFSNTLLYNITLSESKDNNRLLNAIQGSYLTRLIDNLPMGLYTNIGKGGKRLSKGQIQRILIARALYKDGKYLFLDEATSALDKSLENKIIANLITKFKEKTIVLISHKSNIFKYADIIFFIKEGNVIESGNHDYLMNLEQNYYKHVKGIA